MGALTTGLLIASGLAQGASAIKNSQAQRDSANYQAQQDEFNAAQANLQSTDAITRGEIEAQNLGKQAQQFKGAQKAAFAANGVAVDSGSAADALAETDKNSTLDILNIRNNAAKEAFGYRAQAAGFTSQASMTRKTGESIANTTLLTGGAAVLNTAAGAYGNSNKNSPQVVNNYYGKGTP